MARGSTRTLGSGTDRAGASFTARLNAITSKAICERKDAFVASSFSDSFRWNIARCLVRLCLSHTFAV
jgi:hypothetical protein